MSAGHSGVVALAEAHCLVWWRGPLPACAVMRPQGPQAGDRSHASPAWPALPRHLLPATRRGTCHEHPHTRCPPWRFPRRPALPCRSSNSGVAWDFNSCTNDNLFGWADTADQYVAANYGKKVSNFAHSEWGGGCAVYTALCL